MEGIIVRRSGERPLHFQGELLWSGETSLESASPDYSGSAGRAEKAKVYHTASDKYVVAIHYITQWQGEHDTNEAAVFDNLKGAVDYLKEKIPGWLLQDAIKELGPAKLAEEV